jgi:predicted MPP superfamily phosphohydrolase
MKPRIVAIIFAILLIFIALNYYVGWHGYVLLNNLFNLKHAVLYWTLFWLVAFSYVISRLSTRFMPIWITDFLKIIGSYWIAVMLYGFVLLPFADLAAWIMHLSSILSSTYIPLLGSIVGFIFLLIFARGSWNAWNPIIREYEITIPKAAGEIKQLRIAMASDLHLGAIVGNKHLQRLVERINLLKPDLILLPGDIIDDDIKPYIRHQMADVMKQLQAPLGKYAILGNHEYIGGHISEFVQQMKLSDIEVLLDKSVKIADSFYLVGRKDRSVSRFGADGRMELEALLEGIDKAYPLIVMDHQPYHLDKAASNGLDVMLSGHTHRGQMAPLFLFTRKIFELDWGYLKKDNLHAIVSSGYGTWGPPIRLGSRSEIIELIIHFKG